MKTLKAIASRLFGIHNSECVCDNCSYYGDVNIDDQSAFIHQEKGEKGWILKYASERLYKK